MEPADRQTFYVQLNRARVGFGRSVGREPFTAAIRQADTRRAVVNTWRISDLRPDAAMSGHAATAFTLCGGFGNAPRQVRLA